MRRSGGRRDGEIWAIEVDVESGLREEGRAEKSTGPTNLACKVVEPLGTRTRMAVDKRSGNRGLEEPSTAMA